MRILFVSYGTEKAPATRYRVSQYLPQLEKRGIKYRSFSAISGISTALMIKSPDFGPLTKLLYYVYVSIERMLRLIHVIFIARRFNAIFLQRTTFPFRLEILLKILNKNIIFDIDDAIYLPDKEGRDLVTRIKKYVKKGEVINILKVSKTVIVENEYIREFVSRYCNRVVKIPGPIDTERFFVLPKEKDKSVVVGWIGSPATTAYLYMLNDALRRVSEKYDFVKFKFIGLGKYTNPGVRHERVDWSYDSEVRNLQGCDIGIMPMPDNEWTRGKLGCKMLQYMAVGIPAVVSYTPTNAEMIKNGENGFFTVTTEEWIRVLSELIENERLRQTVGQKGRATVVEKCSLTRNIDRLLGVLND
ncbi:MAG: glycosyltransferase family 4 protein [Candidatus Omnitrophica bacterium]|nr:glycosyltransferase family 4 protein [Candidatus Omnitrophota bacterium]